MGVWPKKELKCGGDGKERIHIVKLLGIKEDEGNGVAVFQARIGNVFFDERESEIEEDCRGLFISLFGGVKFYFDELICEE